MSNSTEESKKFSDKRRAKMPWLKEHGSIEEALHQSDLDGGKLLDTGSKRSLPEYNLVFDSRRRKRESSPYTDFNTPHQILSSRDNKPLSYPSYRSPPETPPFEPQEDLLEIRTDDGSTVVRPEIQAKITKGFFMSQDNCWTCYRRNYFSIQCSYSLDPHASNKSLYVLRLNKKSGSSSLEQIQAIAMSLSAAVDGTSGKAVDLVQHTPKRDRGPQTAIQKTKLLPTLPEFKGPTIDPHRLSLGTFGFAAPPDATIHPLHLPQQQSQDMAPSSSVDSLGFSSNSTASYSESHSSLLNMTSHTFERIQFKSATANNGKRRAQQQYYHLIVELWADVREPSDREPNWVKIAERASSQVVVRGRSPSHYSSERPNSITPGSSLGGLGRSHSMPLGTWPVSGGMGNQHIAGGYSMPLDTGPGGGSIDADHGLGGNSASISRYSGMGSY
jgi:meiosis-specific transcription factor NDT80